MYLVSDDYGDLMVAKVYDNDWLWDTINGYLNDTIADEVESYLEEIREEV